MTQTAFSSKSDTQAAIEEIIENLQGAAPTLLVVFAAPKYCTDQMPKLLHNAFPNTVIVGCSTAGEINSTAMLNDSIVAMSIESDLVSKVWVETVELDNCGKNVQVACEKLSAEIGTSLDSLDSLYHAGMLIIDGLSGKEEEFMEAISLSALLPFIGGSAGDNLKFKKTFVFTHKGMVSNSAVICIIKTTNGYDLLKTQSFSVSPNKMLRPTKLASCERIVHEFNNKPAAVAYAEALNCDVSELSSHFLTNPLAMLIDHEPYVRSPRIVENTSIHFYCALIKDHDYHVLNSGNIVEDTHIAIKYKSMETGNRIGAIVNFNCILRTIELQNINQTKEYAGIFANIPTIGFSTYGEQLGSHINQTATMLMLLK